MRKIGAICLRITALAAVVLSPLPAAAFGLHLGPLHIGLPLVGHHYHRHRLYMRANPKEARRPNDIGRANPKEARIRPNDIGRSESGSLKGTTSALLYPSIALPSIIDNISIPDLFVAMAVRLSGYIHHRLRQGAASGFESLPGVL